MKTLGLLITSLLTGFQILYINTVAAQSDSTDTFKIRKPAEIPIAYEAVEEPIINSEVFTIVEDMPQFPGGDAALNRFRSSVKYPESAREKNLQGTVHVHFIIDESGKVTNVEIMRGVHPLLDEAALEACSNMPDWKPGRQRGKPVKVKYIVPITFRLN